MGVATPFSPLFRFGCPTAALLLDIDRLRAAQRQHDRRTATLVPLARQNAVASVQPYAALRIAVAFAVVVAGQDDTPTVFEWSRNAAISGSVLRGRCHAVGVRAKDLLDLARVVRVIRLSRLTGWAPVELLNVEDERTVARLLTRSGLSSAEWIDVRIDEILNRQRLIAPLTAALHNAILGALGDAGLT